jgi:hypothetical protein
MIRVSLGCEVKPGIWHYTVERYGVEGRSRQPLLDACRQIKRMDESTAGQQIGLYREGRDKPDLFCMVGVGAGLTVDESGPYFHKWKDRDPATFGQPRN